MYTFVDLEKIISFFSKYNIDINSKNGSAIYTTNDLTITGFWGKVPRALR